MSVDMPRRATASVDVGTDESPRTRAALLRALVRWLLGDIGQAREQLAAGQVGFLAERGPVTAEKAPAFRERVAA
jgi:hypothetical protein